jgi:hypothetical protein
MINLKDHPDLMLALLAKLTRRAGGYLKIREADQPTGSFNLQARIDPAAGTIELKLGKGLIKPEAPKIVVPPGTTY